MAAGRALCAAVVYYAGHAPAPGCVPIGSLISPKRQVVIAGYVDGRLVHATMGPVCNPPAALARAVTTIYAAAFG